MNILRTRVLGYTYIMDVHVRECVEALSGEMMQTWILICTNREYLVTLYLIITYILERTACQDVKFEKIHPAARVKSISSKGKYFN